MVCQPSPGRPPERQALRILGDLIAAGVGRGIAGVAAGSGDIVGEAQTASHADGVAVAHVRELQAAFDVVRAALVRRAVEDRRVGLDAVLRLVVPAAASYCRR